jgi:hypothetical protein
MTTTETYADEVETPGRMIRVPVVDPGDYSPEEFDPHGVGDNKDVCIACARPILVTAHLHTGICSQRCAAIWTEVMDAYVQANEPGDCDRCGKRTPAFLLCPDMTEGDTACQDCRDLAGVIERT